MNKVTVLIPIGPKAGHIKWVDDAINSVFQQTCVPGEILLIDDQAHLSSQWIWQHFDIFPEAFHFLGTDHRAKESWSWDNRETHVSLWQTPWLLGFSAAFNCGVGLSLFNNIVYLASDDTLYPDAIADCLEVFEQNNQKDAWYSFTYQLDNGEIHDIPINAAMITKGLWAYTGGYPPSAFAGPDALMLSRLMVHAPDRIIKVKPGKPNYWARSHEDQDTLHQASFFLDEMNSIRNKETIRFTPNPEWTNV